MGHCLYFHAVISNQLIFKCLITGASTLMINCPIKTKSNHFTLLFFVDLKVYMGRRKFRPTAWKNYEKKKYQKHLTVAVDTVCNVTDLVIHVSINLYLRNLTILMANVLARGLFVSIHSSSFAAHSRAFCASSEGISNTLSVSTEDEHFTSSLKE